MLCRASFNRLGVHASRSCTPSLAVAPRLSAHPTVFRRHTIAGRHSLIALSSSEASPAEAVTAASEVPSTSNDSSSSSKTPAPGNNVLYVVNLTEVGVVPDQAEFEAHVKQYPGVQDVVTMSKQLRSEGRVVSVGYVVFDTEENAQEARKKLDGSLFNDRKIQVRTHRRDPNAAQDDATSASLINITEDGSSSSSQVPEAAENVLYCVNIGQVGSPPNQEEFEAHVKQYPGVQEVIMIVKPRLSKRSKYVGYVVFDTEENAQEARKTLRGSEFNGLSMKVRTHRREPNAPKDKATSATPTDPSSSSSSSNNSSSSSGSGSSGGERSARMKGPRAYTTATFVRVDNLAWATTDEDLKEHFKDCVGLVDAFITYNKDGRPSGHGFLRFDKQSLAAAAVKANEGNTLDGRELKFTVMKPVRAERVAADADSSSTAVGSNAPPKALSGGSETETRVVVKQLPASFTWREVLGMCSIFGEVKNVQMLNKGKGEGEEGAEETAEAGDNSSSAEGGSSEGHKAEPVQKYAVVRMADRESAERVIAGLYAVSVKGDKLRVHIFRGGKKAAQGQAGELADNSNEAE